MMETVRHLIEEYGLLAVFLGCVAEGESAAILGGFFAHQAIFVPWQAFAVSFLGAFTGDTLFFLLGRSFSEHPFVVRMRRKPGFAHAHRLVTEHPNLFVLSNRYIYGLRLVGGIAAGFSGIPIARFVALNAISAFVWAGIFGSLGYIFGLSAEHLIGNAFLRHQKLFIGLGIALAVAVLAGLVAHRVAVRERRSERLDGPAGDPPSRDEETPR